MIALACAGGSACSHRRRDTGRDTPYHLLDLCRPSDGRRARRDWRRRGAHLQRRLPPCVYDERPRLPVGLAVGAADQGPRACDTACGLTGRERDLTFRGPGTEGSNPAPSSEESGANLVLLDPTPCPRSVLGRPGSYRRGARRRCCRGSYRPANPGRECSARPSTLPDCQSAGSASSLRQMVAPQGTRAVRGSAWGRFSPPINNFRSGGPPTQLADSLAIFQSVGGRSSQIVMMGAP